MLLAYNRITAPQFIIKELALLLMQVSPYALFDAFYS